MRIATTLVSFVKTYPLVIASQRRSVGAAIRYLFYSFSAGLISNIPQRALAERKRE